VQTEPSPMTGNIAVALTTPIARDGEGKQAISSQPQIRARGLDPATIGIDGEMMTSFTTIRQFLSEPVKPLRFHAQARGRHAAR